MSVIGDLVSAANPITAVLNAANTLIDRLVPDTNAAAKAKEELAATAQQAQIQAASDQREINKTEAANASIFVAGWRPAVGWLCVATLAYDWIGVPSITWWAALFHVVVPALPHLDTNETQALLYALLGIGGLRTVDKFKGKDTKGIAFGKK
jgi:hypothetical protein